MNRRWLAAVLMVVTMPILVGCDAIRVRVLLNEGNKLYKGQKYEEAIVQYKKVLDIKSDHWMANYLIAVSNMALYHPGSTHPKDLEAVNSAISAFEMCMKVGGPDAETDEKVKGYYLSLLTSSDKVEKAIEFLEVRLQKEPRNLNLMTQIASLYTKRGNFPKALEFYEKRANADASNKEAWYTIGVACWDRSYRGEMLMANDERRQVVEKGLEAIRKAMALDANYVEAMIYENLLYREKGKVQTVAGEYNEATASYAKAEELLKKVQEMKKKAAASAAKAGA